MGMQPMSELLFLISLIVMSEKLVQRRDDGIRKKLTTKVDYSMDFADDIALLSCLLNRIHSFFYKNVEFFV